MSLYSFVRSGIYLMVFLTVPILHTACLYSEGIPTPPLVPEDLPPVIMNTNPAPFARVIVSGEGQLFEVWLKDPNIADRDNITIDWKLERLGLRGSGSKLFIRPEELLEVSDNLITLDAIAQDGSGDLTKVSWYLSKYDDLEPIE